MKYIFCGAYEPLFFALYLKMKGEQATVITNNENISKYCEEASIKCISYKPVYITRLTSYRIFRLKRTLKKLISKIGFKEEDVFFLTGKVKGIDSFYLSKELFKKGKVCYYPASIFHVNKIYQHPKYKPIFLGGTILKIIYKLFLGLRLIYYEKDCQPCFGIDDDFLAKYNIKTHKMDITFDQLIVDVAKQSKNGFIGCDNLIVDQGLMPSHIESTQIIEMYKEILKLPHVFTFKEHPLHSLNSEYAFFYETFENCDGAPKHIPLELMLSNVRDSVIAAFSTSLIIASKIPHLKSISLLEMISWHNESFKKEMKATLKKKSNNKILFPKNITELEKLLNAK